MMRKRGTRRVRRSSLSRCWVDASACVDGCAPILPFRITCTVLSIDRISLCGWSSGHARRDWAGRVSRASSSRESRFGSAVCHGIYVPDRAGPDIVLGGRAIPMLPGQWVTLLCGHTAKHTACAQQDYTLRDNANTNQYSIFRRDGILEYDLGVVSAGA